VTTAVAAEPHAGLIEELLETERALGEHETRARERIRRTHAEWPAKGYTFDVDAGERVIQFVESYCRHYKGEWAGQPMYLEPWQKLILMETFGWKRADGLRVYRTLWLELGRKNGKSCLAAALALYLLVADGEPGAEVYSSATKRDQAKIVFSFCKEIVAQSSQLAKHCKVQRNNISVARTRSKMEPLSAEGDTLDGLNPHANVIDELHSHKTRQVYDKLVTACASRRQPLTVMITTAGIYDPEKIGWQLHEHAVAVLNETVEDDTWFVWISAADEGDDPYAHSTWEKANPNLNVSIYPEFIEQRAAEALTQPSSLNAFTRLHLNSWTQQVETWLAPEDWDACAGNVDLDELEGRECYLGLDLSSKLDLTAVALLFPPITDDEPWKLSVTCYIPRETMREKERADRVPYALWESQGWVVPTDGDVIDYAWIERDIYELGERFNIQEVAYDPWAAQQTALRIRDDMGIPVVPVRQGFMSLSEPTKELERLVVSGRLSHGGNSCLAWQAANVTIRHDPAGNVKPDKGKTQRHRIDGIAATINALARAQLWDGGSVYESEGIMVL
jgi:phage terminase large subunit-like protein